jgi:hypothetical protein
MEIINDDHLKRLSSKLSQILADEITAGNRVVETSEGWPETKSINVFLERPFINSYDLEGVEFREINDPHWWKSEYIDHITRHILASKFY